MKKNDLNNFDESFEVCIINYSNCVLLEYLNKFTAFLNMKHVKQFLKFPKYFFYFNLAIEITKLEYFLIICFKKLNIILKDCYENLLSLYIKHF